LRRNLLSNLLDNIKRNIDNYDELKIFEIGKVFMAGESGPRAEKNRDELLPHQDTWASALYANKKDAVPFWETRRAAETIFAGLNLDWELTKPDKVSPWEHPARLALISHRGHIVGVMHELHPSAGERMGLAARVGILKINLSRLAEIMSEESVAPVYTALSIYPEVIRDLAFLVSKDATHAEISAAIKRADPLIKKVELFDVFEGKNVRAGHKSMAYHLTYADFHKTLTSAEVDAAHNKVEKMLEKKFGAEVRK